MAKTLTATLQPLHDRILVKRIEEGEVRRGGLIIPDSAKEKPQEGKVLAVGKGTVNDDGSVTCPCHGSTFRLSDGAILRGPATAPQPSFETRVQDGRVEIRARP